MGLSLGRVLPYLLVDSKLSKEDFFQKNFYTYFITCCGSMLLAFLGVFVLNNINSVFGELDFKYLLISMVALPYFLWSNTSIFVFSTANLLVKQSSVILINRSVYLFAVIILVYVVKLPITSFLVIMSIINLLQFFSEIRIIQTTFNPILKFNSAFFKKLLSNALKIHPDTVASLSYSSFITVVVNKMMTLKDVGNFSFALQIVVLINIIPTIINQYNISLITEKGVEASWSTQKKYIFRALGIMVVAVIFALIGYSLMISLFKLESFEESIPVFRILCLAVLPNAFATLMNSRWLTEGKFKQLSIISIITGCISFIMSYQLVKHYSLTGAAISCVISYVIAALVNIVFFIYTNRKYSKRIAVVGLNN
ncbi:MATE family efflux transporter [Chitinophaga silvatica]|uniref:polysaccharide biosynthesis C-terminal domain-containing protein n=1 Tax=Chitinophaga silvatica TaxID=2282649 RepID=UPI0013147E08|nr:polysaccharide biosynthesis C-terminal domain-containing protein [Chitinophaga silvatica]